LAEFKFKHVKAVHRSATKAMAAAPRSCSELTERLRLLTQDEGSSMSTSASAQQVVLIMPKFSKLTQESDWVFSSVSMLLLFVDDQASDAFPYLKHRHYSQEEAECSCFEKALRRPTTPQTAALKCHL
jgi:hypothetical protein